MSKAANNVRLSINRVYHGNLVPHFLDTLSGGRQASCCHFFNKTCCFLSFFLLFVCLFLFVVVVFFLCLFSCFCLRKFFAKFPYPILCIVLAAGRKKGALQFPVVSKKKKRKTFSVPFVMFWACFSLCFVSRYMLFTFPAQSTVWISLDSFHSICLLFCYIYWDVHWYYKNKK